MLFDVFKEDYDGSTYMELYAEVEAPTAAQAAIKISESNDEEATYRIYPHDQYAKHSVSQLVIWTTDEKEKDP